MNHIQAVLKSIRPPFLILTPVCIFLGYALAKAALPNPSPVLLGLILLGALAAHISVNTFNEYLDYRSGLDLATTRTPFSGGSGALVANPGAMHAVLAVAITSLVLTSLIGLYFTYIYGPAILAIGAVGVVIVLTYTSWINRHPWLCLVAPGLGFGPVMILGSYFVLVGELSSRAAWVSLLPFFLVNNLLLLNQFPDREADQRVGRHHFPIAYGLQNSSRVYLGFVMASCLVIIIGVWVGFIPVLGYVALLPLVVALMMVPGIFKQADQVDKLLPYLGINVGVSLLTPILLGIAFWWG